MLVPVKDPERFCRSCGVETELLVEVDGTAIRQKRLLMKSLYRFIILLINSVPIPFPWYSGRTT
jgi:hypothetical protein